MVFILKCGPDCAVASIYAMYQWKDAGKAWCSKSQASVYILNTPSDRRHDDIIKCKHFPCHWPFVRGIHWSPVDFPQKSHFGVYCHLRLNKWLSKQLRCQWFETPSCSLWHWCNAFAGLNQQFWIIQILQQFINFRKPSWKCSFVPASFYQPASLKKQNAQLSMEWNCFFHSQTTMAAWLKLGNGKVISSHTLWWILIAIYCLSHIQRRAPYDFYHPYDLLPVRSAHRNFLAVLSSWWHQATGPRTAWHDCILMAWLNNSQDSTGTLCDARMGIMRAPHRNLQWFISYGTCAGGPCVTHKGAVWCPYGHIRELTQPEFVKILHRCHIWPYGATTRPLQSPQGLFMGCLQSLNL